MKQNAIYKKELCDESPTVMSHYVKGGAEQRAVIPQRSCGSRSARILLDTTDGCAFAIRLGYDRKVYAKNLGTGGSHYPATSIMEIYEV